MCGRFTLTWEEWRQVLDSLGVEDDGRAFADYRPRFNIAPTDQHFIITSEFERRKARYARWGLVSRWAKDNSRASLTILDRFRTFLKEVEFMACGSHESGQLTDESAARLYLPRQSLRYREQKRT
jgi:putative SOS response-associated peptidase YedK